MNSFEFVYLFPRTWSDGWGIQRHTYNLNLNIPYYPGSHYHPPRSLTLSLVLSVSFLLHPSNQQQFASEVSQSIELSMRTHHHPTCCTRFIYSPLFFAIITITHFNTKWESEFMLKVTWELLYNNNLNPHFVRILNISTDSESAYFAIYTNHCLATQHPTFSIHQNITLAWYTGNTIPSYNITLVPSVHSSSTGRQDIRWQTLSGGIRYEE